jgi:hypothetical protein
MRWILEKNQRREERKEREERRERGALYLNIVGSVVGTTMVCRYSKSSEFQAELYSVLFQKSDLFTVLIILSFLSLSPSKYHASHVSGSSLDEDSFRDLQHVNAFV